MTQWTSRWGEQSWGEAELTVSEEGGGSFVEARGQCGMVRSGECYHVLISDTKMKVQACGSVDAQQKSCVVTRNCKMWVAMGRLDPQNQFTNVCWASLYQKYALFLLIILLHSVPLFERKVSYTFKILVITVHSDIWALLCLCFREKEAALVHQVQRWEIHLSWSKTSVVSSS